ncbi:hypothetical protein MMC25_005637 [Agyrium rufum]|nr:hypothetical protein [Agyrium rufum]
MSINAGNIFSANSLASVVKASLPESNPELRNQYDAIALLSHSCMLVVGFQLVGLGEDHKIESHSSATDVRPLPAEWNATTSANYAFRYTHPQSSLTYLVKISRLGNKAVINGLGIEDDKVHTFDVAAGDFTSAASFPYKVPPPQTESTTSLLAADDNDRTPTSTPRPISSSRSASASASDVHSEITALYITPGRVTDFASLMKTRLIQKLAPGIRKEGYEESAHAASPAYRSPPPQDQQGASSHRSPPPSRPSDPPYLPPNAEPYADDPLRIGPSRRSPLPAGDFPPPGFEDEYEMGRGPRYDGGFGGGRPVVPLGHRDLYPPGMGPQDPLRIGPGTGPYAGIGGRGPRGGGGMHPGFDDPIFGGGGGVGDYEDGYGGMGSGRAPAGARYDPVGPGEIGPRIPGRGPGRGGGMGDGRGPPGMGGGANPFGAFGGGDYI